MNWVLIGKLAMAAGEAFINYWRSQQTDDDRRRDRELLLSAIDALRDDVLDTLIELETTELRGELEGFSTTYAAYDPDPNDPAEEQRLVSLIDDSARVIGRLGAGIDSISEQPGLALETWAIYLPMLYLRAQAMRERETTYGADEIGDIADSLQPAQHRLQGLLTYLRQQSDAQFGPIICGPSPDSSDIRVCWYQNKNAQWICGTLRDPRGYDKCAARRVQHMERSFSSFPGVRQVRATATQLNNTIDLLETIHVIRLIGIHIDPSELVIAAAGVQRPTTRDGQATRPLDHLTLGNKSPSHPLHLEAS